MISLTPKQRALVDYMRANPAATFQQIADHFSSSRGRVHDTVKSAQSRAAANPIIINGEPYRYIRMGRAR